MSTKSEELEQIRQAIIQQVIPLMDDDNLDPQDRFAILSRIAQSSGETQYFTRAFRIVSSIASRQDQLDAYMTLLEDLESELLQTQEMHQDDGLTQSEAVDRPNDEASSQE